MRMTRATCVLLAATIIALVFPARHASAIPVYVVNGTALDGAGSPLDGWTVTAANATTSWRVSGVVGDVRSGAYQATRAFLNGHATRAGDIFRADLIDPTGVRYASQQRAVTDAEIATASITFHFTVGDPSAEPLQANLLGAWPFDEGFGRQTRDAAGIGADAAVVGDARWIEGVFGGGLLLERGAYVEVQHTPDLRLTGADFTLAMWVQYTGDISIPAAFMTVDDGPGARNKWLWLHRGGQNAFHINDTSGVQTWLDSDFWRPTTGRWTHVAITREGDDYTHYLDGRSLGSLNSPRQISSAVSEPLRIGSANGTFPFEGVIDEAAMFGRALSATEINAVMQDGLAPVFLDPPPRHGALDPYSFVVYGAAVDINGVAPDGWNVTIEDLTRGWRQDAVVGTVRSGLYEATVVEPTAPPVKEGDVVRVTVRRPDGAHEVSEARTLRAVETGRAYARVDLNLPADWIEGPPPTTTITNVTATPLEDVVIHYELASETRRTLGLAAQFSTDDGATWAPAKVTGRTEAITPGRYRGSLVWSTVTRFPGRLVLARVRLTASDAQQNGPAAISDEFEIRNAPTPIGAIATLPHDAAASFVTFSPDPSILATGSDDGAIRLWSAQSQVLLATMAAHERVLSLAFSPDARLIASGGPDPTAKLWDAQSHTQTAALDGHSGWVASVAFSPSASILATGSHDGTVKLWDLASHAVVTTLPNDNAVWSIAFSPDGRLLAVGGDSGAVRLWNVSSPRSPTSVANLRGHSGAARSVAFSSDGLLLVSGGWDRTVRTWERLPGRAFAQSVVHRGHDSPVWSVTVSPFGELVASGSADATVRAWFPSAPGQLAQLTGHAGTVRSVAFSPDGELLVSAGDDGAVTLWPSPVLTLNLPPTISVSKSSLTVAEGSAASLTVSAVDPDGDPLVFAAESLPANATLDPVTGRFRIEPDYAQNGRTTVQFSVSDGKRGADTIAVDIRVTAEDLFRVRLGPRLVVGGESLTVGLAANHAVPDNVSVTAPDLPPNASFNAAKRELTFTPDLTQAGFYDVTFRVTQRGRLAEEHDVTLRVDHSAAFGLEPSEPQTFAEGQTLAALATRTANAGDDTTLTASPLPPNATFDGSTGRFSFTPDYTQAGAYTITFEARQQGESVQKERLRVSVDDADAFSLDPNEPQLLSGGAVRVIAVELATAAQGAVTVSAGGLPPNASFNAATNEITLAPAFGQTGDHTIIVQASQNAEVVQTEELRVSITDSEVFTLDPPVSTQMTEGESTTVRVVLAADAPDTLTVAARGLPPNATFDTATNRLTFQPDYTQAGAYTITVEVSQNGAPVQAADVRITVSNAEVFTLNPSGGLQLAEGETASASIAGAPAALRAVTFTATDLPLNATFDASTRRLTFSPDYTQAGEYAITVEARQSGQVVQTDEIVVAVTDVQVLSLTPTQDVEIAEGETALIQVNRDVEAPDLTIIARDLPSNASYDPSTGLLTFAPDFRQDGEHTLAVVAMQGNIEVGSGAVRVIVANVPSFTLDPDGAQSLDEGAEAGVQVLKADGAADDVTFNVTGLPRNAAYDDGVGSLRFAPDFAQQGAYTVTVEASQGGQVVDSESVTFTVANVDVLSITPSGSHRVDEGASLTVRANIAAAAAAGEVTLSATGLPTNAAFNPTTRAFTFSPTFAQAGSYTPTIRASQSGRTVEEETLSITVVNINVPPTVTATASTGAATGDVRIGYTIVDFDGDRVSLVVEYREGVSGAWTEASVDRAVTNTATYTGSTNWRTRDDFPSTGGIEVQVRVTPSDSSAGTPATTSAFTLVNLLGDYDEDMDVDFDDVALFTQAWRENDTARDIGPTTGTPPKLTPALDDAIDFEDLATFIVMWNWSAENGPLGAPAVVSAAAAASALVHATIADRPDWRRQRVSFALDEPTDLLAARITLQYDPRQLRIHAAESSDEAAGRVLLNRVDEERGVLDIQTAWLAEGALLDTLASIQIENLRDFDAEIRLSFDIRDRFNTSRRGQDVFRLRFEPPPASTALLQNYPNPFNPETWIPFELSEDAEVTVRIYSVEGALVRTLHLGERALGRYRDRDRAAYWDGANESGEPVASGVYLYELRAGAHRETRRMAIRK